MSVIIRLQGLSWSASAMDIRNFFKGLNIPPGGVHIIGGERGDAFIAFSTDEDARRAMLLNNGKLNDMPVMLFLSSKTEMQNTIIEAKERSNAVSTPAPSAQQPMPVPITSSPAIGNPVSHQLSGIPGLGIQAQLPQINQLSQFLSGLLPNSDLTSSVVNKLMNQQQQQQHLQHIGQPQTKMSTTDSPVSSYKSMHEHALPGEYSVGGFPQNNMQAPLFVNQPGEHETREMSTFGMDRRNAMPPNSNNQSYIEPFNVKNNDNMSSSNVQTGITGARDSLSTTRSEMLRQPGGIQEHYTNLNVSAGPMQLKPQYSRWEVQEERTDTIPDNNQRGNWNAQNNSFSNRDIHGQNFDHPNQESTHGETLGIPVSTSHVATSTTDSKSSAFKTTQASKNETGHGFTPSVMRYGNMAKPQESTNKKYQIADDDEETEIDEFGRTVKKKPVIGKLGDSPSRRDRRDSRERSRDRDRPRRHDSPRRDRDRDRDRRDKDRDRRDRDRRDRDRDRRNRDRDDDSRRDRNRDQDRRNSPSTSDSNRRSKKRSLSPSNTNANEADKKLQTDKPQASHDNLKTLPNPTPMPPNMNEESRNLPPIDRELNKGRWDANVDNPPEKLLGPAPLFPVIPPLGSGQGILGVAPPSFLQPENEIKKGSLLPEPPSSMPFINPGVPHTEEFDRNEPLGRRNGPWIPHMDESNNDIQRPRFSEERDQPIALERRFYDKGPQVIPRHAMGERNIQNDYRGPPNERERGPLFETDLQTSRGPPIFNREHPNRGPLNDDNHRHPNLNQGPPNRRNLLEPGSQDFKQELPNRGHLFEDNHDPKDFNQGPPNRETLLENDHERLDFNRGLQNRGPLLENNRGHPEFDRGLATRGHFIGDNQGRPDFERGPPNRRPLLEDPPGFRMPFEENRPHAFMNERYQGEIPLQGDPSVDIPQRDIRGPWDIDTSELNKEMDFQPLIREEHMDMRMSPRNLRGPAEFDRREMESKDNFELAGSRTVPFDGPPGPPIDRPRFNGGAPPDIPLRGGRLPTDSMVRPLLDPRGMPYNPDRRGPFERPMPEHQHFRNAPEENPNSQMFRNRPEMIPDMQMDPRESAEFTGRPRGDQPDLRRRPLLEDPIVHEMPPRMPQDSHSDFTNKPIESRTEFQRYPAPHQGPPELLGLKFHEREHNQHARPLLNDMGERMSPERMDFRRNSDVRNSGNNDFDRRESREYPNHPLPERSDHQRDHLGQDERYGMEHFSSAQTPSDNNRTIPHQEQPRNRDYNRVRDRERDSNRDRDRHERDSRRDSRRDDDSRRQKKTDSSERSDRERKTDRHDPKVKRDTNRGDFYVRMNNIPLEFNHGDIAKLFSDCAIARKGIKVINDSNGKRTGKAYVQFCNADSHASALKMSGSVLGKRITAVNEVPKKEFSDAVDSYEPNSDEGETDRERSKKIDLCNTLTATLMNLKGENVNLTLPKQEKETDNAPESKNKADNGKSNSSSNDCVIVVGQLSEKMSMNDIRSLFRDSEIAQQGNAILMGEVIKGIRQCFIEFVDDRSLKSALNARKLFRGNTLTINKSSKVEMGIFMKQIDRIRGSSIKETSDRDMKSDNRGNVNVDDKREQGVNKDYHCIRITNLPYDFHYHDFRRLLEGLNIAPRGIQVCHDALGQTLGEGCVELVDAMEAKKALEKDGIIMGRNKIHVVVITKEKLIDHMRHARQSLRPELASQPQVFYFVKAENLPANVSTGEIINYFNGYSPSPESIRLNVGDKDEDPSSSTALVGFRQREDAERAVDELHKYPLRNKTVLLTKVIL